MFAGSKEIDDATTKLNEAYQNLIRSLVFVASDRIIEVTEEFAPDETDFNEAIHIEGPEGVHSLIAVEDEIVEYMRARPHLVDAMRMSEEFDNEATDDLWRAARAVINESLPLTEINWQEKYPADKPAGLSR
ncbi:hypothetical protein G6L37_02980 [Agrobacterium rubi]|nr:hypothetical protein [Agrobacterium rubi]NTF24342.1 hypothetical protein [Agrobacterium rubi]